MNITEATGISEGQKANLKAFWAIAGFEQTGDR